MSDQCRDVEIDGQVVRVRGERDMDDTDRAMLAEVVAAAKRKLEADEAMKAFRKAVMRQAIRYVDAWQVGDGPATFALAVAHELTQGGWTIARISG